MTAEHRDMTSLHRSREAQREGEHGAHESCHNPNFNRRELLGALPESCAYRHVRSLQDHAQTLHFTNLYEHSERAVASSEQTRRAETRHDRMLAATEANVEQHLRRNDHNFSPVFSALNRLRDHSGGDVEADLQHINDTMHSRGLLSGQQIVRDDRGDRRGWGVVADDKENKEHDGHRDGTMVSTSHAPVESVELRRRYAEMGRNGQESGSPGGDADPHHHGGSHHHDGHGHHGHGHGHHRGHAHGSGGEQSGGGGRYNGWDQSVEGGGGAGGGFDGQAVGGRVPPGARHDLIAEALRLAGVPVTEQNISAVNTIVTRESGWNPNVTNNWDSNARAGHPSTGLMQTIPSTFRQYALHGMDNNIHDPLSNLVAGIRYAEARYSHHDGISGVARVASRPGGY